MSAQNTTEETNLRLTASTTSIWIEGISATQFADDDVNIINVNDWETPTDVVFDELEDDYSNTTDSPRDFDGAESSLLSKESMIFYHDLNISDLGSVHPLQINLPIMFYVLAIISSISFIVNGFLFIKPVSPFFIIGSIFFLLTLIIPLLERG